jgi:Arc/MetJ-type ribon-helix-helix transcriptional regulator
MTIHLPPNLENPILDAVQSGRYASLDDAMAEAASLLLERLTREQAHASPPTTRQQPTIEEDKPIWEIIEEENRSIPPEIWDDLPTDLDEQHDHYIYGTPKLPAQ